MKNIKRACKTISVIVALLMLLTSIFASAEVEVLTEDVSYTEEEALAEKGEPIEEYTEDEELAEGEPQAESETLREGDESTEEDALEEDKASKEEDNNVSEGEEKSQGENNQDEVMEESTKENSDPGEERTASSIAATEDSIFDPAKYNLLFGGTDFEDGNTWGFVAAAGASALVDESDGNKYLKVSGSGSGSRSIVKTFAEATSKAVVLVSFEWRPSDVTTAANCSEIVFKDEGNNPVFRLVKRGGTNGAIGYDVGLTGFPTENTQYIPWTNTDASGNKTWLKTNILFDFKNETVSMEIYDMSDSSKYFSIYDLSLSNINYVNKIKSISVIGNRSSGQTLNFTIDLDNIFIYTSEEDAPSQSDNNIIEIVSEYKQEYIFSLGVSKQEVISFFPSTLNVKLEGNITVNDVPVSWICDDYDQESPGKYTFKGILLVDSISGVKNDNNIQAEILVEVLDISLEIPEIEGYEGVYYTDFGDRFTVVPKYWGFTTSNANLYINYDNIAGNNTAKLQFSQINQAGGRVATKVLDSPVMGNVILIKFDWYPGLLNARGNNPYENGGEFRIYDSAGNTIFTINNTRNSPLQYIVGLNKETVITGFNNPEKWYDVEIKFDLLEREVELRLTDKAEGITEEYVSSLEGVDFNGTVSKIELVGMRTSGNNITWTTYLDNFGVYHVQLPSNRIIAVDYIPYKTVYVNTAKKIKDIGLPSKVTVTLADWSKAEVKVEKWEIVDKEWVASEPGVYTFKGILAETEGLDNSFERYAICYVYNRLKPPKIEQQVEWLDRGAIALKSDDGIFVSWRLLADEYEKNVKFNIYRNGKKINKNPLNVTNYLDKDGKPGDIYTIEAIPKGKYKESYQVQALDRDYIAIPLQKPEDGVTARGEKYTYSANDCSVGDFDGDGEYEIIVKWEPSNAIDSASSGLTGPTIFDAYKLDGTPLWRINMGLNLTSGAHYHQFLVYDFDSDGKSEFLIKTADATTVYGVTDGKFDENKIISVIGDPSKNGEWVHIEDSDPGVLGHVFGGPEYISVFDGETGEVIDTIEYRFSIENTGVESWGDTWFNRSDRFLAAVAYLDGKTPSAVYGRGYYARTTFVAYDLVDGKLVERWYFDSKEVNGRGEGMGNHNIAVADVDNDGFDEIIAGSMTLDHDGTILYVMDGQMGRKPGSHGDALHVGAFDPDREGIQVFGVHEVPAVASLEYHDAATGETLMAFFASKDTGRGVAANITTNPGYEFWGAGHGTDVDKGSGIYNVQGKVISDNCRAAGLPMNFALYWDGDLLHELLDDVYISKYDETTDKTYVIRAFEGVVSNNGTKATPCLQADILGDWREEVIFATVDSSELRIYSTTIPTEYRIFTLMHDHVYRLGIAWQNVAYNQPPHLGFYLGEDIRDIVLKEKLNVPSIYYVEKAEDDKKPDKPEDKNQPGKPGDKNEPGKPGDKNEPVNPGDKKDKK